MRRQIAEAKRLVVKVGRTSDSVASATRAASDKASEARARPSAAHCDSMDTGFSPLKGAAGRRSTRTAISTT